MLPGIVWVILKRGPVAPSYYGITFIFTFHMLIIIIIINSSSSSSSSIDIGG
jgi:hypothetical protein